MPDPGTLGGSVSTAWATADAAVTHSIGEATPRGQSGALGRLAWNYACVAGGHAADLGLGFRDADSTARTSTAANGGLAVAAGAVHRPLRRRRR
jgi:hypothetical protein